MADKILISVDLNTGDVTGFERGVEDAARKSGDVAGKTFGKNFSSSASNFIVGAVGFEAIRRTLTGATQAAVEFQSAFTEINTLLPANAKLSQDAAEQFRQYATQFGTSAAAQAKSYYQIVSAGITDTTKATKLLDTANQLAIGGVASVTDSIDILTTAINSYGVENLNSQDAADSLFTTVKLGKTNITELASTLGTVLTPAKQAGVSFDEVNAAIALFTTRGVNAAKASTQLNSLFASFVTQSAKLGAGFSAADIRANGLTKTLELLSQKTGGSAKKLQELLVSQESVRAAQILLGNEAKDFSRTLDGFASKAGAAGTAFKEVAETDAFKLTQSLNTLGVTLEKLGANLLPTVVAGVQRLADVIGLVTGQSLVDEQDLTALAALDEKLAGLIDKEQELMGTLETLQKANAAGNGQSTLQIQLIEKTKKSIADLQVQQAKLLDTRKKFTKQSQAEINANKAVAESAIETAAVKTELTDKELQERARVANAIAQLGFTESQLLQMKYEREQALLVTAKEMQLITEMEYNERLAQVRLENEANQLLSYDNLTTGFQLAAQQQILTAKNLANAVNGALSAGFGRAFLNVGKALKNGDNAFSAFGEGIKNTLGDVASATGDLYIKQGVGLLWADPAAGAGLIAAGGALKVLAGTLGGGGGSSSGGVGGGDALSGGGFNDTSATTSFQDNAQREVGSTVNITVAGSLVQQEELGLYLEGVLNDTRERNGTVSTNVRVA